MRRLTRSRAHDGAAGSRTTTAEKNDSIPDSSGLRLGNIYEAGHLLSRAQQVSETVKPGRVLRDQYKQNGDFLVTCTSRDTASCSFQVFATEEQPGLYVLGKLALVHSPQCMQQAIRTGKPRPAKPRKETKPCSPYDNTSGDEATPELEVEEVLAKYRSSSTDSGPSTSTPTSTSRLASPPIAAVSQGLDTSPPGEARAMRAAKPPKQRNSFAIQTRRSASVPKVTRDDELVLPFQRRGSGPPAKLPSFKKQKISIDSGQIDRQHFNPDVSSIEQLCAASAAGVSDHVEAFYAGGGASRGDWEDSGYS